jgi:hypothetical protein
VDTEFWSKKLKLRDQSMDIGVDGRISLIWILRKQVMKVVNELNRFRIGSSGGLLATQ